MNIRQITDLNPNYFEINREERNYAAILFATLCKAENAKEFLKQTGFEGEIGDEFGVYFEYAYLRDLWSGIHPEDKKRDVLRKLLPINGIEVIVQNPFENINRTFGVSGKQSSKYLQFPGKWSIRKFHKNFPDNDDFRKICCFKWSFNIKPDIVIHIDKSRAICIEAKHESGEGSYPSSESDKSIFQARGLDYVGQTALQKYMMEELLGLSTKFIFLVSKEDTSQTHNVLTWREAFNTLDMAEMPKFAKEMANRISN